MQLKRTRLLFVLGIAASQPALAQAPQAWIGPPDCRMPTLTPPPAQAPSWSGGCKDGFIDGKGTIEWHGKNGKTYQLLATFLAGQVQGAGELRYVNTLVYTGTFRGASPDGHGYVVYANGDQFEGEFRMGWRSGLGEMLFANGNNYKGEWKDDKLNGTGVMTYMLGGRYEGGWKDGKRSGQGKLVYAGGQGREVATVDGRDPNRPAKPTLDKTYTVKEDLAPTGTQLRRDVARAVPVPPDKGYEQLSAEEQASVDSWFPALAPGDEPPYPRHGPADFYKLMSKIVGRTGKRGEILVVVTVGASGRATEVRAVGLDDPEVRKLIAAAAIAVEYKPARCAGQPCEMAYPYRLALTLE